MWLDILALVGAIWLIVRIVVLRQVAALPFARQQARFVDAAAPAAIADLVAQANTELDELGFEPARWMHVSDADGTQLPLRLVRVHRSCHAAVWLAPPTLMAPNRMVVWYVTRMLDGRTLITQPFDVYFQLLAREQSLVQATGEPSFAGQWAAHCALVASHGATDPAGIEELELLGFHALWMERQRQALIAARDLVPVNESTARPSLAFAWRAIVAMGKVPKPPADARPVPPARIALLATQHERMRERSPSRQVEWTLFALSVGLFMALGALLWSPMTAWMILVVVVIHELGHFLAMRAFGYRNVHMMALPLVGGVAIGQDVDPSAHRSAWMSLMGPLPGILIGWAILLLHVFGMWPELLGDGSAWATMFLLLNYLNVLPVPPLDGAHVVQALLPPRRARIEVGFVALACVIGAWAAWDFGFVLLTALALLQLLSLPHRWQAQRALAAVAQQPPAPGMARPLRIRVVADALERLLGATPHGKHRVEQALDVLQRLDRKPMSGWQTLLVGGTLALLLVVPVGVGLVMWVFASIGERQFARSEETLESREAQHAGFIAAAQEMSDAQLIAAAIASADWADPPAPAADAATLAAAEARIGMPLPAPLQTLYRQHDGIEALGIGPLASVERAAGRVDAWFALLEASELPVDILTLDPERQDEATLSARTLRDWLLIGSDDEALLLFNPDPAAQPVQWVHLWAESPSGYRSLREWLQSEWVSSQQQQVYAQDLAARQRAAHARLAGAGWDQVLAALQPQLPLAVRLLADAPALPDPASVDEIAAAEQRLGRALPADYRDLLLRHNGYPMLGLDAVAQVHVLDTSELARNLWLQDLPRRGSADRSPGGAPLNLGASAELVGCWALQADTEYLSTSTVLCPAGHQHAGVIDLRQLVRHPDLLSMARTRAAQVTAMQEPGP